MNVTADYILFGGKDDVEKLSSNKRLPYLRSDQIEIVDKSLNLLIQAIIEFRNTDITAESSAIALDVDVDRIC